MMMWWFFDVVVDLSALIKRSKDVCGVCKCTRVEIFLKISPHFFFSNFTQKKNPHFFPLFLFFLQKKEEEKKK